MLSRLRHRISSADPLLVDALIAIGLAALVCLQLWSFTYLAGHRGPMPPGVQPFMPDRPAPSIIAYTLAVLCFLPLAFRRKVPWLSLTLSGGFALAYALMPRMQPAFTMLAPMIALYTLAAQAKQRRVGGMALIVTAVVISVPLIAFSGDARWLRETVSSVVLLSAAALLGDSARSRREYIEEVEQRALEAERTREEEARRRVDEERIRIAREVHDVLAHSLSIVAVQAAAAESLVDREPERARESIQHIRGISKQALAELRSMLTVLRTSEGDMPLEPATTIDDVLALVTPVREAGFTVDLETTGDLGRVPAFAAVSGYRIVQEALTNAVRHADPDNIIVRVEADQHRLTVLVQDDGSGDSAGMNESGVGHGIRGMRERVEALGGDFSADSPTGGGFRVLATIPLGRTS